MNAIARINSIQMVKDISAILPSKDLSPLRLMPVTTIGAGASVYAPGDRSGTLYRVEFGAVRLHRLLSDGRRQVVAFYLAGETFGLEAEPMHSFFAEAIVPSGLRALVSESDRAAGAMLLLALRGMLRAQEHIMVIGRQTATERIAGFLIDMAERQGGLEHFDLPMSRLDIADYLGLTIETVSRVFAKLRAAGFIKLRSIRCVEISRAADLKHLCA